jgi:glycosyltransferase involved in cell wall biosynthesis
VLAYVVTEDWYFLSHRLPMARAALKAGFDVHVIAHVNKGGAAIEAEGFRLHPVVWRRGSVHPLGFLLNICAVRRVFHKIKPALVHNVALQPTIVGSLAALGLPSLRLNALAGLGFTFTSATVKARLVRPVLEALLRLVLKDRHAAVLVQNPDDQAAMGRLGVPADRIFVIPGSGVETDRLTPMAEPAGPVTIAFVGRLLDDKGVRPLVAAQALLARRGAPVRLLIAGDPDPANPVSIPPEEIAGWANQPGVEVPGAYRCAALPPRGPAQEPLGGGRLRTPDRRHRRTGLPRDRAARRQCAAGSPGRPGRSSGRRRTAGGGRCPTA